MEVVRILRASGKRVDYPLKSTGFGKQFKQADAVGAKFAVIVGEDEVAKAVVKVKNLKTAEEQEVSISDIVSAVA